MLTTKKIITEAAVVVKHLNGLINVYKPSGVSVKQVQKTIVYNMCRGERL